MKIDSHHDLWQVIGNSLLAEYSATHTGTYFDASAKGDIGEGTFRNWLTKWLPKRFELVEGRVIDKDTKPTSQRDAIIFDSLNCAIIKYVQESKQVNLLPIEGVKGIIEVNHSSPSIKKVLHDADKIADVKKMVQCPQRDEAVVFRRGATEDGDLLWRMINNPKKFGYIFIQDIKCSLKKLAEEIKEKNYSLGIDQSVDGIFVLGKGVILHGEPNGWLVTRLNGSDLYYMEMEPWDVLLTLVAIINKNLSIESKAFTIDFEEYFRNTMVERRDKMFKERKTIDSCSDYVHQISTFYKPVLPK